DEWIVRQIEEALAVPIAGGKVDVPAAPEPHLPGGLQFVHSGVPRRLPAARRLDEGVPVQIDGVVAGTEQVEVLLVGHHPEEPAASGPSRARNEVEPGPRNLTGDLEFPISLPIIVPGFRIRRGIQDVIENGIASPILAGDGNEEYRLALVRRGE